MTMLDRLRIRWSRTVSIAVQGTPRGSAQHMARCAAVLHGYLLQGSMQVDTETAARREAT